MKCSLAWLRSLVAVDWDADQLAAALTSAGLEVETVAPVAPPLPQVVVGEVIRLDPHPNADRLRVAAVDCGEGELRTIVCGAANVAVGFKAACALPGAVLPNGMTIRPAKLRGVDSAGMLCSASELGLETVLRGPAVSGLLPLPATLVNGTPLVTALGLDDVVLDLKITPNRADCLSMRGLAREVAALTATPLTAMALPEVAVSGKASRSFQLADKAACPLYLAQRVRGVNAQTTTPAWMTARLERAGLRAIAPLVDITNYVMLETGQPLHAFDNQTLRGQIVVRWAKDGETLTVLSGETLTLSSDTLVIADDSGAIALAGLMGGQASGCSDQTTDVLFEAAHFTPAALMGRARRYQLTSQAAMRFERGVDPALPALAMQRAVALALDICGGVAEPVVVTGNPPPARPAITLRSRRINRLLGMAIPAATVESICQRLALAPQRLATDSAVNSDHDANTDLAWQIVPPSWRFDLAIEADLIEEVVRIYGYDAIPTRMPTSALTLPRLSSQQRPLNELRRQIAALGYHEAITYAFIDGSDEAALGNTAPIRLANPIAQQHAVMRSSLLPGLLSALAVNLQRKQSEVRLFEIGRVFHRDPSLGESAAGPAGYRQPQKLALLAYGSWAPLQWGQGERRVDFYDLKGDLECLLPDSASLVARPMQQPILHPGRSAEWLLDGVHIGFFGELHPNEQQRLGLPMPALLAELDLTALLVSKLRPWQESSNYPAVTRDLALVVDQAINAAELIEALRGFSPERVVAVTLFDIYAAPPLPTGKKSLAFRLLMQDTQRTLQDTEVDALMADLLTHVGQVFGAELRR